MLVNRSMPRCTVIPVLTYPDIAKAVDWLCAAFGFTLRIRIGDHRAQLNVGDGCIVVARHNPGDETQLCSLMVRVDDVDKHFEQASGFGVPLSSHPVTYPYGERQYGVDDLAGHRWTFSQSVTDVNPEDWGGTTGTMTDSFSAAGA